jgi:ABC-type molybdate transport system substrate-binding protein
MIKSLIPTYSLSRRIPIKAQCRMKKTVVRSGRQVQGCTLGAQTAEIGRMFGVAFYTKDSVAFNRDQQTAAHAAVTTGRFDFFCHGYHSSASWSNSYAKQENQQLA